jgi:hypothetical protein
VNETIRTLRFRAARTPLRAPFAWWRHRDIRSDDVLLASFERSGSTWLRFLLCEILTGDSAAFEHINKVIPEMGRQAGIPPVLPGKHRLIKTHEHYRAVYRRAIYLVRDLRDVMLSNFARMEEMDFVRFFSPDRSLDGYLAAFLKGKTAPFGSWQDHVNSWFDSPLAARGDLLVIRFEDLRRNTETNLAKIVDFLGMQASAETIRQAIEDNSLERMRAKEDATRKSGADAGLLRMHRSSREDGRFVRKGAVGGWRAELTRGQLQLIDRQAGSALLRAGYELGAASGQPSEPDRVSIQA